MNWVPISFVIFKLGVLGIGMYFAIKWHYDQGKKEKVMDRQALVRASGKVVALFMLGLLLVVLLTFFMARVSGIDLSSSY